MDWKFKKLVCRYSSKIGFLNFEHCIWTFLKIFHKGIAGLCLGIGILNFNSVNFMAKQAINKIIFGCKRKNSLNGNSPPSHFRDTKGS